MRVQQLRYIVMHKCIPLKIEIVSILVTPFTISNDAKNNTGMETTEVWQYAPHVNVWEKTWMLDGKESVAYVIFETIWP